MLNKLAVALLLAAGCGNDQVTTSGQVEGTWARADTTPSLTIARMVTFDMSLGFMLSMDDGTTSMGTYEVNNLYVLLYPVSPPHTTWCTPNATLDGSTLKFDDFDTDCATSPNPPGLQSPLDGAYTRQSD